MTFSIVTITKISTKQQYKQNNINNSNINKSIGPGIRIGETIEAGVVKFDGVGSVTALQSNTPTSKK